MEYNKLGKTDLRISRIGLGAWQFSYDWGLTEYREAKNIVSRALELGINFFDTAMVYGVGLSENILGKALREIGIKRDEVVVSTKIPGDFLNPQDIYKSVQKSLQILGLRYIDILLAHWPPCWHNFPTYKYARALEKLVKIGYVNYLGLSNFPIELVESFRNSLASSDVEVLQIRYNLVERGAEEELIPYAEAYKITVQAWSPIAKGALTGKYTLENLPRFDDVRSRDPIFDLENFSKIWPIVEKLREIGEKYGKKPVQVALNWLIMSSPVVVPIPGAKNIQQVEEFAESTEWRMNFDDWRLLEELSSRVNVQYSFSYLKYKEF
ncbi:MAG: aldo/keto reductase [Aigarchaeota archaeon]|nr:aldo/keto reductase [Aigarchaeota archaeon]MCX8192460.1 aldo/keto reductase [Nitrososphaeria archaeon]MDW7986717.1 aldo/keto reductase [Nitrososphaerota archaeon]